MRIKKKKIFRSTKIITFLLLILWIPISVSSAFSIAPDTEQTKLEVSEKIEGSSAHIYFFGREGCGYCRAGKDFLDKYSASEQDVFLVYYDVTKDKKAGELFENLIQANGLSRTVPYAFVGGEIISGFGGEETTGKQIIELVERARNGYDYDIKDYLNPEDIANNSNGNTATTTTQATSSDVVLYDVNGLELRLPLIGVVDVESVSLSSLSVILGLVDGFNPCALWVLMTFLLILMQIGDKKKMFYVAGLFIFAESIMYYLILNVWYKTWDFIALDQYITPLIGIFTVACGVYFLYKYRKTKDKLTCDVTSIEKQASIQNKIHKLVNSPMTLPTIIGIIAIALSVNVIEFACSIGIPQAFTKILEINVLEFWTRQWYLFLYILAYMVDDFIVFGFALYGFDKIHQSQKYSKLSILVGGILMIFLGSILLLAPDILIF